MTASKTLTLASRKSPLALAQTELAAAALRARFGVAVAILPLSTRGDDIKDKPLAEAGGKALFVKTLQQAVQDGRADAAVHSLKDMEASDAPGLTLAGVGFAADERDALVPPPSSASATTTPATTLAQLPAGAIIGTCSPRRAALLSRHYPHLQARPIRGNLQTRLAKLAAGDYHALLLAAAGLERLRQTACIGDYLPPEQFIPAVGQGLLGLECAADNRRMRDMLAAITCPHLMRRAAACRAFARAMQGNCHTALGARATLRGQHIALHAFWAGDGAADGFYETRAEGDSPAAVAAAAADNIARMRRAAPAPSPC